MGKKEVGKTAALVISAVVCCIALFGGKDWAAVGLYSGCGLTGRFLYHFFHANIFHAVMNVWCLLSVVFIYEVSAWRLLTAYIVASLIPIDTLSLITDGFGTPTVGLSGIVFVLFGAISFEVGRKIYYQAWMLFYLAVGFLFPNTNAWIHLYCYMVGFVIALLTKPINITHNE